MSNYVNVGAIDSKGQRVPTKKALKELVAANLDKPDAELIMFDQTSMIHSGGLPGNIVLRDLPEGHILSVVGPDPYRKRNWYANVERRGEKVIVR